jgi:fumarylacetoacetase
VNAVEERAYFGGNLQGKGVFRQPSLNAFMALGRPAWREARTVLTNLLRSENPTLRDNAEFRARALHPIETVTLHLPAQIGDYTDFYASREHAANVGTMLRGADNALMPNWLHLPVGYHGRASSVIPSGVAVTRPRGQVLPAGGSVPRFAATGMLDFELEMGFFIGPGNALGEPIPAGRAEEHIFGLVLLNDWSARDIQAWEYQPLGPFLSKNFATSISPWVVTLDALAPFAAPSPAQEPEPLPYLQAADNRAYDVHLEVALQPAGGAAHTICRSNLKHLYWSLAQQAAHHTITGCNLRPGDLCGTGTISGRAPGSYGSLLELTWRGQNPLHLPGGAARTFLQDGDTVIMTGWCEGDGYRVGFGEVSAKILPAVGT